MLKSHMKYFFLSLLLILTLPALAQDFASNFRLSSGKAVYEHILYNEATSNLKESLKKQLLSTGGITNIQDKGQYLTADIYEMMIDYRKYGATNFDITPPLAYPFRGKLLIEFRDGRYKANIRDIVFIDKDYSTRTNYIPLEKTFVRNNRQEFRSRPNILRSLRIMNMHFMEIFTLAEANNAVEDW